MDAPDTGIRRCCYQVPVPVYDWVPEFYMTDIGPDTGTGYRKVSVTGNLLIVIIAGRYIYYYFIVSYKLVTGKCHV
jgi:hypothetical protein